MLFHFCRLYNVTLVDYVFTIVDYVFTILEYSFIIVEYSFIIELIINSLRSEERRVGKEC